MPDRGSLTPAPAVRDDTTTEKEQTDGAPLRQSSSSLNQMGELQEMETENQKVIDETDGDTSGKNSIRRKRRSSVDMTRVGSSSISRSEEEKRRHVQQEDDEYHQ